jgi:hypothetical protein
MSDKLDFLDEYKDKKNNKMIIKKIQNLIEKYKDNLEILKSINDFTSKCIEEHKYIEIENKLKDIIPDATTKIIKILEEDDAEDSRITNTIELLYDNYTIKIYKQVSICKSDNNILEEFYISVNSKKIVYLSGEDAYKINCKIEDKTLEIKECIFVTNENIFKLLHFFELY